MANADPLLTLAEACKELRITRTTFYEWRRKRRAPASLKLPNGAIRIRRSVLDAWLEDHEEVTV
jgi:excisionase family DNA binding protein